MRAKVKKFDRNAAIVVAIILFVVLLCILNILQMKRENPVKVEPDVVAPKIVLNGAEFYFIDDSISSYEEKGFAALDNRDGDLTKNVQVSASMNDDGTYKIKYSVSDSSGNKSTASRTIAIANRESIGTVYLTFDDGPSKLTPKYLDVLKEYGVNATFFTVGFSEEEAEWKVPIMQRALEEGNRIAMHGMSHEYSQIYSSLENIENNFYSQRLQLLDNLGIDTKIIRFPGGSSNMVSRKYCKGVMTQVTESLTKNGYTYFDWNVDSNDAGEDVDSSENIYKNVVVQVKPGRDNVILMHDASDHQATLEALPKIIKSLKEEGYEFRILDDKINIKHNIFN